MTIANQLDTIEDVILALETTQSTRRATAWRKQRRGDLKLVSLL